MMLTSGDLIALRSLFELILDAKGVVTKEDIKHIPTKCEFYNKMEEVMKILNV